MQFSPRIEDFASIDGKGEAIPFIGLDLIGHHPAHFDEQHPEQGDALFSAENPIWVGARLNLQAGAVVHLLINDVLRAYTVAGVLKPQAGELGEQNVIVADIGLAQIVTGKTGKLDTIDVRIPASKPASVWRQIIASQVPASVDVAFQGARTDENRKMLSAFRWNLRVLSYIALVVGAFLIYNTISVSVVRRRHEIGVLRALGATRAMIGLGFLAESLFFALAGSALGLLLGRVMAVGAVALIGKTVESLYVSSEPSPIHFTVESALAGVALGVIVSLLAALAPAIEAARVAPVEAMARGREEFDAAQRSHTTIWWALLMLLMGAGAYASTCVPGPTARGLCGSIAVDCRYLRRDSYHRHAVFPLRGGSYSACSGNRCSLSVAIFARFAGANFDSDGGSYNGSCYDGQRRHYGGQLSPNCLGLDG